MDLSLVTGVVFFYFVDHLDLSKRPDNLFNLLISLPSMIFDAEVLYPDLVARGDQFGRFINLGGSYQPDGIRKFWTLRVTNPGDTVDDNRMKLDEFLQQNLGSSCPFDLQS